MLSPSSPAILSVFLKKCGGKGVGKAFVNLKSESAKQSLRVSIFSKTVPAFNIFKRNNKKYEHYEL